MIIVGAKGLAKEILQIISVDMKIHDENIVFFDNVSRDLPEKVFDKYNILKSFEAASLYLSNSEDKSFVLGLGNPNARKSLYEKFIQLKAKSVTIFSNNIEIGDFDVRIDTGTSIMAGARISNSVKIGKGCLIYYNAIITHDCRIGDFVEVSPNATILGRCKIGDYSSIGASSVILPDVIIGNHVLVGAGTVVLKDVPDNCTIVGVPGKIISTERKI